MKEALEMVLDVLGPRVDALGKIALYLAAADALVIAIKLIARRHTRRMRRSGGEATE